MCQTVSDLPVSIALLAELCLTSPLLAKTTQSSLHTIFTRILFDVFLGRKQKLKIKQTLFCNAFLLSCILSTSSFLFLPPVLWP